jgi:hypothetical protein
LYELILRFPSTTYDGKKDGFLHFSMQSIFAAFAALILQQHLLLRFRVQISKSLFDPSLVDRKLMASLA